MLKDTVEDDAPVDLNSQIEPYDKYTKATPQTGLMDTSINKSTQPFKIASTKPGTKIRTGPLYDQEPEETGEDEMIIQDFNDIRSKSTHPEK